MTKRRAASGFVFWCLYVRLCSQCYFVLLVVSSANVDAKLFQVPTGDGALSLRFNSTPRLSVFVEQSFKAFAFWLNTSLSLVKYVCKGSSCRNSTYNIGIVRRSGDRSWHCWIVFNGFQCIWWMNDDLANGSIDLTMGSHASDKSFLVNERGCVVEDILLLVIEIGTRCCYYASPTYDWTVASSNGRTLASWALLVLS